MTDFPDWVRQVVVNPVVNPVINVKIENTPPAPVPVSPIGSTPAGTLAAVTLSVTVNSTSTKLIDHTAYPNGIVEWSISLPGGKESVWLAFGQAAVPAFGIELTSPGAVSEQAWNGDVYGIASTGGFKVGVQVVYLA